MKERKEQWKEDVLNSMKGSQRAKPSLDLFNKITQKIHHPSTSIIPMHQWRIAITAASILLALNFISIHNYLKTNNLTDKNLSIEETSSDIIISEYQLYD